MTNTTVIFIVLGVAGVGLAAYQIWGSPNGIGTPQGQQNAGSNAVIGAETTLAAQASSFVQSAESGFMQGFEHPIDTFMNWWNGK